MTHREPMRTDVADLEDLFQRHGTGLAGAARGVLGSASEVAEVLQEAFLKALRRWRAGPLIEDPVAWLFVIVLNAARDHRRTHDRRHRNLPHQEVDVVTLPSRQAEPVDQAQRRERLGQARAAIHRLGEAEREVFLLRVSGGCTFAVIAATLGIPVATAKSRMRAALRVLQRQLVENES